ncbi:hypothetical protein Acsp04_35910 [Actinomadura sp. NBRC 104425]|uniref:hypothetical protein n=1 Tax=Actinomadura sp. NBRC 104425 TaxID=3032204 RepID=UPI0024A5DD47|nr:hypothetical protein [Actinomadura sp. NBRC 104425]GLZ13356.1 hypothetical protein Acsp04_35910 [Actinomadura sp. NBRC 104425]
MPGAPAGAGGLPGAAVDGHVGAGDARRQRRGEVDISDTAPPLVVLHRVTANVLRIKLDWNYAMARAAASANPEIARVHADVVERCDRSFRRARAEGLLRADVDPQWARRCYYALVGEVTHGGTASDTRAASDSDIDALATRIVDTLLRGVGAPG